MALLGRDTSVAGPFPKGVLLLETLQGKHRWQGSRSSSTGEAIENQKIRLSGESELSFVHERR